MSQIPIKRSYNIQMPQTVILNLDSTLLEVYDQLEGMTFNYHYQSNGYHLFVCYDGITSNLLKIPRNGTSYSCTDVTDFCCLF
ncbi:transposase [Agathobacter sp.]